MTLAEASQFIAKRPHLESLEAVAKVQFRLENRRVAKLLYRELEKRQAEARTEK
jgi:hypothetical protein